MAKKPLPRSSKQIRLALTREDFRRLLYLVYIGTWVLDAHKTADDPRVAPYDELEQKILAVAERHGFGEAATDPAEALVEYAPEFKKYYPTRLMDEGEAREFLDEYDNDTFWDELMSRLAERDAIREVGGFDRYAALSGEERIRLTSRYEVLYADEFHEHGLENVRVTRPHPPSRTVH